MNPPLRRRIVIDLTTIGIFWLLFIGFVIIGEGEYDKSIASIIDLALMFFTTRLVQLVAVMNPMVQELVAFIKNRGNSETKDYKTMGCKEKNDEEGLGSLFFVIINVKFILIRKSIMDILFLEKALTNSDWLGFKGNILSGFIGLIGAGLGVLGAYLVMQKQLKAENEQYRKDRIDNTFFNLLGLFQTIKVELEAERIILFISRDRDRLRSQKRKEYMDDKFSQQKDKFVKDLLMFNKKTNGLYSQKCSYLLGGIEKGNLSYSKNFLQEVANSPYPSLVKLYNKYMKSMDDFQKELEDTKSGFQYEITESDIKDIIKNNFVIFEGKSGNYLRALYRCLKYIMDSDLKMEDKKFYSGVLRGILSSKEMLVVFYNCMYFEKGEKFKELLEKEEDGKRIDFFGDKNDLENLSEGYDLPFFSKEDLLFSETDMQKLEELIKGN